jgi:two-component system, cell cycle sensor histidine kinase and response regulator CckA
MRVLFMSGYTDDAVVQRAVQHHRVPFLQKPFSSVALLGKVQELLNW